LPAVLFLRHPDWLMQLSHMSPSVESRARDYLGTIAWGLPAVLLYRTFYAFTNALGRTRVLMFISLAATAVHIPLSWVLINGHLGSAAMGGAGCAVSSACIAWLSLAAALVHVLREPAYAPYRLFSRWQPPRARAIGELLRLGLPMGFSSFVEITAFTLIALLVAGLGADVVAGHRIVGNLSALIYMLPLAIAIATLVLVGRAVGARDGRGARHAAKVGIGLATGLSTLVSIVVWLFREPILAAYTADPAVLGLAVSLVIYICLYQFFDAIQTVAAHALRVTRSPSGRCWCTPSASGGSAWRAATGWPSMAWGVAAPGRRRFLAGRGGEHRGGLGAVRGLPAGGVAGNGPGRRPARPARPRAGRSRWLRRPGRRPAWLYRQAGRAARLRSASARHAGTHGSRRCRRPAAGPAVCRSCRRWP
jgi:putative MATE family efflux protein